MEGIGILLLLSFKHVIADYFLQKSWMIKDKSVYGAQGGIAHATTHTLGTLFVLFPFYNPLLILFLSILDGVAHYHIDYLKSNYNDKYEYILPEITFDKNLFSNNILGNLDLQSNIKLHNYDTNKTKKLF